MKKTSLIKIISLLLCLLMVTSSVSIISVGAANNTTCKTHTYDKGKVTTKATCKKTGVKTYTCTVCGKTKTKKIEKTSHKYVAVADKKATTKSNGKATTQKCSVCGKTRSKKVTIAKIKSVKLSATSFKYNGKVQKPTVTVKDSNGKKLKKGTDYTVTYSNSKSKQVGTYTVKVKFKGNYSGKKTLTYKIVDDQSVSTEIAISSLKNKTKEVTYKKTAKGYTELNHKFTTAKRTISEGVTVKWNKVAGVDGYQVQYSLRSDFSTKKKYNLKTVKDAWDEYIVVPVQATYSKTVSGGDKTSVLINGTVAEKYYFRVRTYKTVDGAKVYSSWSAVKSIKALYSCAEILNGGKASNGLVGDYRFNQKFENAKLVYGGNKYHVCTSLKDHYEIACNELYECKYCSDGYHCKGNYIYNTVLDEFGHKNNFGVKCPEYNEEDKKQDEYDASHCDVCGKPYGIGKGKCNALVTGYKAEVKCPDCGKTIKNPDYASYVCHECLGK